METIAWDPDSYKAFGIRQICNAFSIPCCKKTKPVKNGIQHLILDDTLLTKCGKVMEGVGRLWYHVVHLIGMMKMGDAKYNCQGVELNSGELLQRLCKKSKRCRKLKSNYIHIEVIYKGFPVKLFFSRFGKRAKWHLILHHRFKPGLPDHDEALPGALDYKKCILRNLNNY